jgi:hypothetical protein
MTEETEAGKPEGEALPEAPTVPATIEQRVVAAIDAWHERHVHESTLAGRPAISADDKAALIASVTAAVAPATKE